MDFKPITDIIDSIGGAIDENFTSDEERLKQRNKLEKVKAGIKEKEIELQTKELEFKKMQMEQIHKTNQIEASHRALFVSSWRPAIGWVCCLGLLLHYLVFPLTHYFAGLILFFIHPPYDLSSLPETPNLDIESLGGLLCGLLGLSGLRTIEKKQGVALSYISNQKVGIKKI